MAFFSIIVVNFKYQVIFWYFSDYFMTICNLPETNTKCISHVDLKPVKTPVVEYGLQKVCELSNSER